MRTAFIDQLIKQAEKNEKIFLLVGDLGYNVVEAFANRFPERFKNVGIAEQNMAGVAAGLAMSGFNVYFYSIGNFPTLRCIEQIRNDIAYHKANVKVVAVGGGYAYGDLGATHHATEALGIMRTIPNIVVCSPADPLETRVITTLSSTYLGPMYIQLGKAGETSIHSNLDTIDTITIGDIIPFKINGMREAVMVTGSIAAAVVKTEKYKDKDIFTLPFIKPLNYESVKRIAENYQTITVVEEQQLSGGVGSAVIEVVNELYMNGQLSTYPRIRRVGIQDVFQNVSGSQSYLRQVAGLL